MELAVSTKARLRRVSKSVLRDVAREDIRLVYTFENKLGSGSYGTCRVAYKTVNPSKKYAIKSMKREDLIGEEDTLD